MTCSNVGLNVGRGTNQLSAVAVRREKKPGRYGDGGGLYLEVLENGRKRWLLRYQMRGRRRDMILGAVTDANGLAAARQAAQDARSLIARGIDPIDARKRPTGVPTFADHSRAVIEALAPGWRGRDTRSGWERSLLAHAAPVGKLLVDQVTTADVVRVLSPIWTVKAESGAKLRERIERVLDHARAAGHIAGAWENPARWRGHLALMLPKRVKLQRGHMRAIPYATAPAFMARLRAASGMGAAGLEVAILTAAREGMVIGADWSEVAGDVWTVPGSRMKGGAPFVIPLTKPVLTVLDRLGRAGREGYIFKGSRRGTHISDATMDKACKTLKVDATPHGFRSTFRDWAGDCTDHPREIAEMCLAHVVGDAVERAYRRGDALAKRRRLLEDWAVYLGGGAPPAPEDPTQGSGSASQA